ncbi:rhodanese-like domain-containing protein [Natronosalvus vescus]|uniref:rhodanese-like domain-containing protein n=1 Tax=Natronosalvus vescus TaxID=2953881 RepID=UPI0020916184|nr:rhodanese-like domain-containing protein [Natronosalvus vescus]
MQRRSLLASVGAASLGSLAGCLGDITGDDEGETVDGYDAQEHEGQTVPLVPLEEAHDWFDDGDTRFVDTRGPGQYESDHIEGAVLSSAPDGVEDDPTEAWDHDTRIVTYCDCPHTLAVWRGSALMSEGFEDVYALDDGFPAWQDAGYPTVGEETGSLEAYEIVGRSAPEHEGNYVWLTTLDESQREVSQVEADGSYKLIVRFDGLSDDTVLSLKAPEHELEATLEELTDGPVTA